MKRQRKPKPPADWQAKYLKVFRHTGNVMRSAQAAGVSRSTVYAACARSKTFATAVKEAEEEALEVLELEAHRRAVHGTKKPVFYKGARCGYVREFSDTLMIVLLKARAPEKYRENKIVHTGPGGGPIPFTEIVIEMPPDEDDGEEPLSH